MSSFKELNGPLETEFHSFYKLEGGSNNHPSSSVDLSPQPNDLTSCQTHSQSGENYIAFDQSIQKRLSFGPCAEKGVDHSNAVQHLRATMPDQTRSILKTTVSNLSEPISIVNKNFIQQQNLESGHIPISDIILQHSSPRLIRRYSKPQGDSCDFDLDPQQDSSVDGDQDDLLRKFQNSLQDKRLSRRRSSPEILEVEAKYRPPLATGLQFPTLVNNQSYNNAITDSSSTSAISTSTAPTVDYPIRPSQFPRQNLTLNKMVDNKVNTQNNQPQVDNAEATSSSSSSILIPSKSCPRFHTFDEDLHIDIYSVDNCSKQSSATLFSSQPKSAVISNNDCNKYGTNSDSVDSSASSSGFGFLSKTRQFGTWLGLSVDSKDKMEISKKDLNVFAPTTF